MNSIQSFNVRAALAGFGGDHARFTCMARMVKAEMPYHIATLRDTLGLRRLGGLEFSARLIGNLLEGLLATACADAARDLETAARRQDQHEAERAFESLEDEIEEFLEDLQRIANADI